MRLGRKDMEMLTYLRQDARITLTNLSRKTTIPISTLYEKVKRFRSSGLIKLTALVDFHQLGFSTRLLIALKVDKERRNAARDYLISHPHVNTLYRINNGYTFMVEALFADISESEDFLSDLESRFELTKLIVFQVIEEVSREMLMADPQRR